jgi:hypothetical protein
MRAASLGSGRIVFLRRRRAASAEPSELTLRDLVEALCEETDDDHEVVATALEMLRSGRVRRSASARGKMLRH